ncbi:hypothetical protein L1049_024723 [Liquidambar formosana]|uniref:Uncharacterized protein n=1 Tax=Liquidambar formosana TaxID=63359 RepID=A0AAP0RUZ0_LIQFO
MAMVMALGVRLSHLVDQLKVCYVSLELYIQIYNFSSGEKKLFYQSGLGFQWMQEIPNCRILSKNGFLANKILNSNGAISNQPVFTHHHYKQMMTTSSACC